MNETIENIVLYAIVTAIYLGYLEFRQIRQAKKIKELQEEQIKLTAYSLSQQSVLSAQFQYFEERIKNNKIDNLNLYANSIKENKRSLLLKRKR